MGVDAVEHRGRVWKAGMVYRNGEDPLGHENR